MMFFVGAHQPQIAKHLERSFVSINVLRKRKSDFQVNDWILDSGAFSQILNHGEFIESPEDLGRQAIRWQKCGNLLRAVSQDYMCEAHMLEKTGLTVRQHQEKTCERWKRFHAVVGDLGMPVLQGFRPQEYVEHLGMYGDLPDWVGVGSVCKRNGNPSSVLEVLGSIKSARPSLKLHGFGLKTTALAWGAIRDLLFSADSMAWSYAARYSGRDANSWREAVAFAKKIESQGIQEQLL